MFMNTEFAKSDWRHCRTKTLFATSELPSAVIDTFSIPVKITGLLRGLIKYYERLVPHANLVK
jgi:hypothetical protein